MREAETLAVLGLPQGLAQPNGWHAATRLSWCCHINEQDFAGPGHAFISVCQLHSGHSELAGCGGSQCMFYCTNCIFSPATVSHGYQHPLFSKYLVFALHLFCPQLQLQISVQYSTVMHLQIPQTLVNNGLLTWCSYPPLAALGEQRCNQPQPLQNIDSVNCTMTVYMQDADVPRMLASTTIQ